MDKDFIDMKPVSSSRRTKISALWISGLCLYFEVQRAIMCAAAEQTGRWLVTS